MDPESLLVILPCWLMAITVELGVASIFMYMTRDADKKKRFK